MHFTRIAALTILASVATACSSSSSSSSPTNPVIDDFTMPDTATVQTVQTQQGPQQAFDMKGTISFHDDKENVTQFLLHVDVPGATVPDLTEGVQATAKQVNYPVELLLQDTAPKGPIDITVTLFGASGAKSDPVKKTVTLQ